MAFTIPNYIDATDFGGLRPQAAPDAQDIAALVAAHTGTGVVSGCGATVTGSNMLISIAVGVVLVNNVAVTVAAGDVTVTAADATNPRFDLVTVTSAGVKAVTKGTAAANPVFPTIPAGSVLLHAVYVPANDVSIQSTQIVDKRVVVAYNTDNLAYLYF